MPRVSDERASDSPSCSSHSGSRDATVGITAKLYGGGGDEVDHSSDDPPHGFAPAGAPLRRLTNMLTKNSSTPIANRKLPIVVIMLSVSHPIPSG